MRLCSSSFAVSLRATALCLSAITIGILANAQTSSAINIHMNWSKTLLVSKSTPTLQVVSNPMLNRGAPLHDSSFAALKALGGDYVRYVPWLPYPRLSVAELEPPANGKTSWDFSNIDPMLEDFMNATKGHHVVVNFSTIPQWMYQTDEPVPYPDNPDQVTWNYCQGTELRDDSMHEAADYFARVLSWYTKGGFTDEYGKRWTSGHHYGIDYWEVLNEVENKRNHRWTAENYTRFYDTVVEAMRKVDPNLKFMGMALSDPRRNLQMFEYFLDPKNHKPGIPLDFVSYHFYASPAVGQGIDEWQYSLFDQASAFANTVRAINQIRDRLSPSTKISINELGTSLPADLLEIEASKALPDHIPHRYWNISAAVFAYLFIELSLQGVDVINESQLVGYPSQWPSVSMMDYNNGKPNARYWALKIIEDNFHAGDALVESNRDLEPSMDIAAQGFLTREGKKILLVNKRNREVVVELPAGFEHASLTTVDEDTGDGKPRLDKARGSELKLAPFAVTVLKAQ